MITVMLLGFLLVAVSDVSAHLNQLLHLLLADEFNSLYFQVGSEGRDKSSISKLKHLLFSLAHFLVKLIKWNSQIVHLNTSLEPKNYFRDVAGAMDEMKMLIGG